MDGYTEDFAITVGSVLLVGLLIWMWFRRHELILKARMQQSEYRMRLLEKFSNASEIIEFAESEKGRALVETPPAKPVNTSVGVIRTIQVGIASIFIGGALLIAAKRLDGQTDMNFVRQALDERFWGTVGISLGIGLVIAGGIAYVLAQKMGLINKK